MSKFLAACVCAIVWSSAAFAQPLADRVPADAVAYVGWAGTSAPGYDGSHLQGVVDHLGLAASLDALLLNAAAPGGPQGPGPIAGSELLRAVVGEMWRYPSGAYLPRLMSGAEGSTRPPLVFMWQAGKDADDSAGRIKKLLADDQDASPALNQRDGVVVLSMGLDEKEAANLGTVNATPLSKHAPFLKAVGQAGAKPAALLYLDVEAIIRAVDVQMVGGNGRDWMEMREVLGLQGIKRLAWGGGFDKKNWTSTLFIEAPTPRSGIASLFDAPPIDERTLKFVPAGADGFVAAGLDLGKGLDELRSGLVKINQRDEVDRALAQMSHQLGFDVNATLRFFGSSWVIYSDPAVVSLPGLGLVAINQAKDAAAAAKLEQSLLTFQAAVAAHGSRGRRMAPAETREFEGGIQVNPLPMPEPIPLISPSWTVQDDRVIVSLSPQGVATAAQKRDANAGSILDHPAYKELAAQLGGHKPNLVAFADLQKSGPTTYQLIWTVAQFFDMETRRTRLSAALPPYSVFGRELNPSGAAAAVGWADDAGYHLSAVSPFPGSAALHPLGIINPTTFGLIGGLLVPSVGPAHQTAQLMQSATQARGIHQGCILFAQGNNNMFPADFMLLLDGNYFTPNYVISPQEHGKTIPVDFQQWPREKKAQWVAENTSYVLVPGLSDDTDTKKIAIFEKLHSPGLKQIPVVFNDNHVEMMTVAAADARIKAQTGRSLKEWSDVKLLKKAAAAEAYAAGDKLYLAGKYREAADAYRKALDGDPAHEHAPNAAYLLAKALDGANDKAAAIEAYESFVAKYPDHASVAEVKKRIDVLKASLK